MIMITLSEGFQKYVLEMERNEEAAAITKRVLMRYERNRIRDIHILLFII
jgi:hypothetical protein